MVYFNAELNTDFGDAVGLEFNADFTLKLNTSGHTRTETFGPIVDEVFESGFYMLIDGDITFFGAATAGGTLEITINQDKFELYFNVFFAMAGLDFQATGFAGLYYGYEDPGANGLALLLDVSIDAGIGFGGFDVIKIKASGKLKINTTNQVRNGIDPNSFYLDLTGEVKILEVIKMDATFRIEASEAGISL